MKIIVSCRLSSHAAYIVEQIKFDPSLLAALFIKRQNSPSVDCPPTIREHELGLDHRKTFGYI